MKRKIRTGRPRRQQKGSSISAKRKRRLEVKGSEEKVLASRRGKINALRMSGTDGDRLFALEDAEHPYRALVETTNDGVATLDAAGVVLYANRRFATIFKIPAGNFTGSSLLSYISESDRAIVAKLIAEGLSHSTQGEITPGAADGGSRLVRLTLTPMKNSEPPTVCVVATELTELVEANEALRSNEESLRQLSARLLTLQDEERRHIARDLHDITGQKLALQSMALSQVLNRKPARLDAESRRILSECATLTHQVSEEIRTLSYLLHPPLLDELGLSSAVRWYAEGFEQRTGIQVKIEVPSDFRRLPPDVEVTLFRVIQESLTNVHRYSGSPRAYVRLEEASDKIILQIGDFGKGMYRHALNSANGKAAPLGVGIQGMRERLWQLAGRLEITSQLNQGTLVTATVPLPRPQAAATSESARATAVSSSTSAADPGSILNRNASRRQILIADDHEMLRRGLRTMLEGQADWEICGEAIDGQEAVEKAKALRPDLVILDMNMPVLNGLAAVRQILRNRPQTKILVFTVHDSDQTVREIQAAGAHAYVSKSHASDDVLNVVKNLLGNKESSSVAVASRRN